MKYLLLLTLALVLNTIQAQITHTWDGGGVTNNFTDGDNWDSDVVPDVSDNVVFDGTSSKNCTFDQGFGIFTDFTVDAAYTGTVDCVTDVVIVSGNCLINGGTFISTAGTMFFQDGAAAGSRNITVGAGVTFLNNNGVWRVRPTAGETINCSGTFSLNTLQIDKTATGAQSNINFGTGGIIIGGAFNFTGSQPIAFQGRVDLKGNIQARNTSTVSLTANTATWTISGAVAQTFSGTTGPARGYLPNITINRGAGALTLVNGTAFNLDNSVWRHTAGTYGANTTSTLNIYGTCSVVTSGATADHLVINTGATLTAPVGNFNIRGNFTNNGTFIHNNGTVVFARTATSTVQATIGGSTTPTTFFNINTANVTVANTKTITLNTDIDIVNSIDINNNTKINVNGKVLQLLADNTRRAYLASSGTSAQVIGNVKVNTFARSGSTGWTTLGVAGVTGNTFANWEDDFTMTCSGCPLGTNLGGTTFVSVTGYVEATEAYPDKNYTDALTPGQGYWVYLGTSSVTTTNQTITVTGPPVVGSVTAVLTRAAPSLTALGFNLIANPYAAPITWASAFATNSLVVNNAIYVWNPDLAGGAGAFAQRVGGISSPAPASGGINTSIPAGQGFYVEASAAGTFTFLETHKSASNTSLFTLLKTSSDSIVLEPGDSVADIIPQHVFRLKLTGANNWEDETVFHFNTNATTTYDQLYDAHKYATYGNHISSVLNGEVYSINALPLQNPSISILVRVISEQTNTYTISPIDINEIPGAGCVILHDNYLNINHDLRTGAYVCTIADTTTQARFSLEVCASSIVTSVNSLAHSNNMNVYQNEHGTFVKTHFVMSTKATISAYNLMGQKIMTDKEIEGTDLTTRLDLNTHNQVVIIKVTSATQNTTKKIFVN